MDRVLILGGSGLVGEAVMRGMGGLKGFEVYPTYFQRPILFEGAGSFKLNIEDTYNIENILDSVKPRIVVSCLRGDFEKQLILHRKVARYLREVGGRLYFFSTTNVFDGDLSRPHYEDEAPNSVSDYGQYKMECEREITEILDHSACILRLPQVWGRSSPRMEELADSVKCGRDIVVYPGFSINANTDVMVAAQTRYIIENDLRGVFHLASEDVINYKDFYNRLIAHLGFSSARFVESLDEQGCFALLSKRRGEFPEELRVTNKSVIEYLAGR